jgi:microcystin-dependent protein
MSDPYIGEIRIFAGNFAPAGWAFCDGSQLAISENDTLFTLIGTTYGGDGQTTFNLPDLRGRVPLHNGTLPGVGTNFIIGETLGVESVTITSQTMPLHTHPLLGADVPGEQQPPANNVTARSHTGTTFLYVVEVPSDLMAPAIGALGGSQPHENLMPYLCINFIISLFGIFPSPT